ncbi:MAG: type II toxin-antitoxin system RelB/DinJ family antitoxin [Lachnospiraceae bacterium]|nr:type II toxin-antitoxin system RelB/DinJ family antitoxin [Lachnospiraceae bacterium]
MIMGTVNVTLRIDDKLKKQADDLFSDLGLTFNSATTVFLRQAVREQQIPFKIKRETPDAATLAAINEVEKMKKNPSKYKSYSDVDEMMDELLR